MENKIKKSADDIINGYLKGAYDRETAHELLSRLNHVCFDMFNFELATLNPGKMQEYIHALQDKYTVEYRRARGEKGIHHD